MSDIKSSVIVINKDFSYLPTQGTGHWTFDTTYIGWAVQLITYSIIWMIVLYLTYNAKFKNAYIYGYTSGIVLGMTVTSLFGSNIWHFTDEMTMQTYKTRTENVKWVHDGKKYTSGNDIIVLTKNTVLPKDDRYGYIIPTDTFLKYITDGSIEALPLFEYLDKYFQKMGGFGKQDHPIFYLDKYKDVIVSAFYSIILVTTLTIYIVDTKWWNFNTLSWMLMSIITSLISAGFWIHVSTQSGNIFTEYIMKRLFIVGFSFIVTTVSMWEYT